MPIQCRVECYDRSYSLRCWSPAVYSGFSYDYLTLETNSVTATKKIYPKKGDFVKLTAGDNQYDGIISDINNSGLTTVITMKPLESLFDVKVYKDRNDLDETSLENFLKSLIEEARVSNEDAGANIQGIRFVVNSTTNNAKLYLQDNIQEIWTIAVKALKKYGVIITAKLELAGICVTIGTVEDSITIEADGKNVISKSFSLQDDYGKTNTCLIINKKNETQQARFYANDYNPPSAWETKYVDCEEEKFEEEAEKAASDLLTTSEFNNLIEIEIRDGDRIISNRTIGCHAVIISKNMAIPSMLTGYSMSKDGLTTLVFGAVRLDLSKILLIERRNK